MNDLAINGGSKVFDVAPAVPRWPRTYPETAEKLKDIYLNNRWSFYAPREVAFNEMFAKFNQVGYCTMMANGTVTLELALRTLGVQAGDEVIVPAHTWMATGTAVAYLGAIPVIVDIESDTLCMDPAAFEAAITPRTKAVIPVHLFGSMANMDEIMRIARKHHLAVVEDCAHAHGGQWDGKYVGSIGDIGSFSFQESKIMASGEGGACITNNAEWADKLGRYSHIGYSYGAKQGQKVLPPAEGMICHNYRITDFQAEILISQLEHLTEDNQLRAQRADFLRRELSTLSGLQIQAPGRRATLQSYYTFCLKIDPASLKPGIDRDKVVEALQAEGVDAFVGWGNVMYKQRLWTVPADKYRIASSSTAEKIVYNELFMLPLQWLMLTEAETALIVEAFRKVLTAYSA